MSVLSIQQLAQLWVNVGGDPANTVDAVAVAEAESGGNTRAVSPAHDYGVWQINEINFAYYHITAAEALEPVRNGMVAVAMSAGGSNWAPWCTAWADPGRNCGHGHLAHPQPGSSAYARIPEVSRVLAGGHYNAPPPVYRGNLDSATGDWRTVQRYFQHGAQIQWDNLDKLRTAIRRIRT